MYGVIAEDQSDVEVLKTLMRKIAGDPKLPIKAKGYGGCGEMLRKGASQLRAYRTAYALDRFVVCYDSDRAAPHTRRDDIVSKIIVPSGLAAEFCALVPVQEIEAWILADLAAVSKVITSWKPSETFTSPELTNDPKEILERLSARYGKPLYSHATHNPRVAEHLDLTLVGKKCPSFRPLVDFVRDHKPNVTV